MHEIRNFLSPYSDDVSFWNHYESEERTLALFLKLTPSEVWADILPELGFTSHSENVDLAEHDLAFVSSSGLNPSTAEIEQGKPSNMEMMSVFDEQITEADLLSGKWRNAYFELWLMNYEDLNMGELVVHSGILTDVKNFQTYFQAEVAGISSVMDTNFGDLTSRTCRNVQAKNGGFGGFRCLKDLNDTVDGLNITKTLTVFSVPSRSEIWFTRIEAVPDDFYTNGKITGLDNNNEDLSKEIRVGLGFGTSYVKVFLKFPFPLIVEVGDTFSLIAGCNGSLERCMYFENIENSDAEFFIPTIESVGKAAVD